MFQKREIPENIQKVTISSGATVLDALLAAHVTPSKSEARRLLYGGAVKIDGKLAIRDETFTFKKSTTLKIGKRKFLRVVIR